MRRVRGLRSRAPFGGPVAVSGCTLVHSWWYNVHCGQTLCLLRTNQEDRTISDDPATQTGASGSGDPATGAPASGGDGGAPAGFVSQAALDSAQATIRQLQSERDRATSELTKAREAGKPAPAADSSGAPTIPSPDEYAAAVMARLAQRESVRETLSGLSQEYPNADPSILSGSYGSPEEARAAAEASHRSRTALVEAAEARTLKKASETYGFTIQAPQTPPDGGEGGKKELTAKDIAAMPMADRLALDPDVFAKALRS